MSLKAFWIIRERMRVYIYVVGCIASLVIDPSSSPNENENRVP